MYVAKVSTNGAYHQMSLTSRLACRAYTRTCSADIMMCRVPLRDFTYDNKRRRPIE